MSLDIKWSELISTVVSTARGAMEIEAIDPAAEQNGGFLSALISKFPWLDGVETHIYGIGERLKNWGINAVKGLTSWSVSAVWGAFISIKNYTWNFNWNITDDEIDNQLKQLRVQLASLLGSTVGCGFGWAAGMATSAGIHAGIGAIASSLGIPLLAFDKASMWKAIGRATEEGIDEIAGLVSQLATAAIWYVARAYQAFLFKNGRKLVKWLARTPAARATLPSGILDRIDGWGEQGSKPFSYAIAVEEMVDSIPNQSLRAFVDSFLEEADECFIEAGYVYAANVDSIMAERADMREAILGTQQVVEVIPDREAPNEMIVLAGREQNVRTSLMTTIATHQMINNRDVGQIVGMPANEQMLSQAPVTTLTLRLIYYPVPTPPFTEDSMLLRGLTGKWVTTDLKVPFIDPIELDWLKIKRACGISGRTKGRVRCYGYLAGRKIEVYANSESEGESWLNDLASLSEAKDSLTGVGFTRRKRNLSSSNSLSDMYESVRVYPAYAIVLSQKLARDKLQGRATLQGNFTSQSQRIELWTDSEPSYCKEILSAMKQYHTPLEQLGIGFRRP